MLDSFSFGSLVPYLKPRVSNVGFKFASDFKLHRQIGADGNATFLH